MANWRDRNERDAKPNTIDVYSKPDVQKKKNTNSLSKLSKLSKFIKIFTLSSFLSLLGLVLVVTVGSVISEYINFSVKTVSVNSETSRARVNQYVCQKNSEGNLETSLIRDNGERQLLIKWNSSYLGSEYTPNQTCSEMANRLNKYTKLETEQYIAYTNTKDSIKICVVKSLGNNCTKENIVLHIKSNPRYLESMNEIIGSGIIDYIKQDCNIYPNLKIKESDKMSGDTPVCFFPLMKSTQ
jgi:Circadian oscillating protein COP23